MNGRPARSSGHAPWHIPLGLVSGLCPTVTTRSGASVLTSFTGGQHFPVLGIMEIGNGSKGDKGV